jgi:protein involved in polysaccharide export with SLBB domain
VARMAVSSANVVMVVGEVGRSAVYMRYSNGPRIRQRGLETGCGA